MVDLNDVDGESLLRQWLADPAHRIPLHRNGFYLEGVNWALLKVMLGVRTARSSGMFVQRDTPSPTS